MSDPLLDKMDALLRKHRGGTAAPAAPVNPPAADEVPPLPEDVWLPVLTEVVAVGKPELVPQPDSFGQTAQPPVPPPLAVNTEALVDRILGELEPRLSALLLDRLATEVRNCLNDSLTALLAQVDVHIREIVHKAIREQLDQS